MDAGRYLVCLVACLVVWVYVVGVFGAVEDYLHMDYLLLRPYRKTYIMHVAQACTVSYNRSGWR